MALDVDALYRSHSPMVLRRCRRLLRDEEQALEAMQDTFVQMIRNADRLDARAPSSLLYRTATNLCLNRLRSRRRRPEDADDELVSRIAAAPDDTGLGGARLMLASVFAREQPSTKTMAVLHLLDGLTLEEVAEEVGLSVSGVRKRLRTLKQHVAELEDI
ncbi:MAG: sigma-70 family RNA polymerase sigma factor [Deltaproteobacteria bacterium]|nr:sigma-70 family RNA polymerase sigma factor [Deltaproteobacteria bacterium]